MQTVFFIAMTFILYFLKCNEQLQRSTKDLGGKFVSMRDIIRAYKQLRRIQLLIQDFNVGFSYHIFVAKLFCITNHILLTASGILIFESDPAVASMGIYLGGCYALMLEELCGRFRRFHT
ncbi:unnamed protein product [Allacma fusca]|uniref:Uncharacterized protein n=1 Tax=Allacma fusca TaxID=39272 RepID=A0A8J2M1J2_9HEXA|nr:unnamed protein product [Allacma fusca]